MMTNSLMEGWAPSDFVLIGIAVIVILIVVFLQFKSFVRTREAIKRVANFFPSISSMELVETSVTKQILSSRTQLNKFINNPPARHVPEASSSDQFDEDNEDTNEEYVDVSIIKCKSANRSFNEVLLETNSYLCKNVGTSADFPLLQDICERKIDSLETEIANGINVPLYLGLAGTFIGIILGLFGISFNLEGLFSSGASAPLRNLLIGVVIAMLARLLGLSLMIWNSAITHKKALNQCDKNKNQYYDFLRQELMPVLSNSMASSLNSLKSVLGEFVGKFGHNLDAYTSSAELLNDNIEKQHLLLVEVNKMKEKELATEMAGIMHDLKDSSEAMKTFRTYQDELNNTMQNVGDAVSNIDTIIKSFTDFAESLNVVVENQKKAEELQNEFKAAIENHFPTGSEGREMWRTQFDNLSADAAKVSEELNEQLKLSTEYIRGFVEKNQEAFSSVGNMQDVLSKLIEYTDVQANCYKDLKEEIAELKKEQLTTQSNAAKLNADLITAVREMISAIKSIKS